MKINKTQRESLMKNKNYKRYDEKKQELKNKYDEQLFINSTPGRGEIPYSAEERKQHKKYLEKICSILIEPNGDYQKFTWDIMSSHDLLMQERKTRRRINDSQYN
jgi:hypothetical protein